MNRAFRKLHFDNMEQAMAETERLIALPTITTGKYSFGQILEHLARTLDVVTGTSAAPPAPWFIKLLGPLVVESVISQPAKHGFKLPAAAQASLWPTQEVAVDEGANHVRAAYQRFASMSDFPKHPFFGTMSAWQHQQLQCRHFALHLGFVDQAPSHPASPKC